MIAALGGLPVKAVTASTLRPDPPYGRADREGIHALAVGTHILVRPLRAFLPSVGAYAIAGCHSFHRQRPLGASFARGRAASCDVSSVQEPISGRRLPSQR